MSEEQRVSGTQQASGTQRASEEPLKIVIVSGSLSESSSTKSLGTRMAQAVAAAWEGAPTAGEADRGTAQITDVELRDLAHDITNAMLTGFPSPKLDEAFEAVGSADAVIAVTPAYNASYSGLFKSFFDVLPEDRLRGVPVLLGATGGTPRHSLIMEHALRPLFMYLHAVVPSTAIYAATEDFGAAAADSDAFGGASLQRRIERAARELVGLIHIERESGPSGRAHRKEGFHTADATNPASAESAGAVSANKPGAVPTAPSATNDAPEDLVDLDPTELFSDFKSFDEIKRQKRD